MLDLGYTIPFLFMYVQVSISQLVMIPDPDPADSNELDDRHPSKLTAAEQMCTIAIPGQDPINQLYNHDQCGVQAETADPNDPESEVLPEGFKQGELSENDTVIM